MIPITPFCVIVTNYDVIFNGGSLATFICGQDSFQESIPCETCAYNYLAVLQLHKTIGYHQQFQLWQLKQHPPKLLHHHYHTHQSHLPNHNHLHTKLPRRALRLVRRVLVKKQKTVKRIRRRILTFYHQKLIKSKTQSRLSKTQKKLRKQCKLISHVFSLRF